MMGVDIIGLNPKNEKGGYFRSNWWYWRPIWTLTVMLCKDFMEEEAEIEFEDEDGNVVKHKYKKYEVGLYNDGLVIDQKDAEEIGKRILEFIEPKDEVQRIADELTRKFDEIKNKVESVLPKEYHLDKEFLKEWAEFCLNCGGFRVL